MLLTSEQLNAPDWWDKNAPEGTTFGFYTTSLNYFQCIKKNKGIFYYWSVDKWLSNEGFGLPDNIFGFERPSKDQTLIKNLSKNLRVRET